MNAESTERDRHRMTSRRLLAGLSLVASLVLVGCSHAPEYSIFGSFFPVLADHLAAPVLLYLGMATFFACVLWLLFYS
jgi:hypothetical protein